jgi:hypothetical protein
MRNSLVQVGCPVLLRRSPRINNRLFSVAISAICLWLYNN